MDFYYQKLQVIPRPKPMKVLILGLPRTATTSICAALKVLRLKSYHWNEVLNNKNNGHLELWLKAVQAKYDGVGKPFAGEDFDQMLWDYDAVSDEPCCFFIEELIAAYPDARVILTTRNREGWLLSMRNSILEILSWKSWTLLSYFDPEFTGPYLALLQRTTSILSKGIPAYKEAAYPALLQSFDEHHEHVRAVVSAENLLEFHPSQGWTPLCSFLQIPEPEVGFPHLNEPSSLVQIRKDMFWERFNLVAGKTAKKIGVLGLAVAAAWYMGSRSGN